MYADKDAGVAVAEDKDGQGAAEINSDNVLDKWILIKLNKLMEQVVRNWMFIIFMKPRASCRNSLTSFPPGICAQPRSLKSEDENDKKQALTTTRLVLANLAKIMARLCLLLPKAYGKKFPAINFADENESVHLEAWPAAIKIGKTEEQILIDMDLARQVVEIGLAKRDEAGIKIRQMLSKITVTTQNKLGAEYLALIKDELNVKEVVWLAAGKRWP